MWLAALPLAAFAEDPKFEKPEVPPTEEVEKPEVKLSAEFGGSYTSGNSNFYTITSTLNGSYKANKSKFGLIGGAVLGAGKVDADGNGVISDAEKDAPFKQNAGRYFADLRYDFFLGEKNSLYVLVGGYRDQFAGFDLRTHEQLGYGRVLVDTETTDWNLEVGVDFAQENYVDGVEAWGQNVLAGRAMTSFSHKLSESVSLQETIELYENVLDVQDLRVLNQAALSVKLSEALNLKLSHNLIFDNQPVEGYRKADSTLNLTLVATLF